MVNGAETVYVERRGRIEPAETRFADEEQLRNAIERILAPLGRRVDELSPMVDARLADGSRVNVVIPPLAVDGPVLSIRRFGVRRPGPRQLVEFGDADRGAARDARRPRCRSAAASSSAAAPARARRPCSTRSRASSGPAERVVTIEDAAELRLQQPHVVRLESRPAGVEGRGEVTIRDLLRNALRMRPDRIVIGEVRGPEALDLLTALNTGHDGALSTVHANSPEDAVSRIETLALMAGVGLPHDAIADAGAARHRPRRPAPARPRRRPPGDRDRRSGVSVAVPAARLSPAPRPAAWSALAAREGLRASPAAATWLAGGARAASAGRARGVRAEPARAPPAGAAGSSRRSARRLVRRRPGGGAAARGRRPGAGHRDGRQKAGPLPLGGRAGAARHRRSPSPTR